MPLDVKAAVAAEGSKSAVFVKYPVTNISPVAFTAIDLPWSVEFPPMLSAHKKFPEPSSFVTNTSSNPDEVSVNVTAPGSKSAEPEKYPAIITLPEPSSLIDCG